MSNSTKIYVATILIIVGVLAAGIYYVSMLPPPGPTTSTPTPTPLTSSSPTFSPSPSPTTPTPSPNPSPSPQTSALPVPVVSSARNWAGYVVASDLQNPQSAVVGVSGSWTVPAVTDIGIDAFSAIWIGIGGQFDRTLIQAGTEQDFVGGQAQYSVWY